jgi:RNA polymerase sigma factor (sigma-70 family)
LTEAQRELATRYMPLARTLARQAGGASVRSDELEAEAYAALVEAAQSFDAERGVNFAIYARLRIVGALRDYRRFLFHAAWRGESHEIPVFQRLGRSDDSHGWVLGKEHDAPLGAYSESLEAAESVIRLLPRSQAMACRMIYIEGKSQDEAARAIGCTKSYVSRLHAEALTRLGRDHREALAG